MGEGYWRIWIWGLRRTPCGGSRTGHGWIVQTELLKLKKNGHPQYPDESVKIKGAQIHYVLLPDVLTTVGIHEIV
jgi:hypothetical protein